MRQLEGDADAREVPARIRAQLGRDHRAGGELALELVVVGDDDVHAERLRLRHLCPGVDAAVDGDEQLDAGAGELVDRRGRDPVALAEPVGQAPADVRAELGEHAHQQEGRGDAVGIVVAVDGDGLSPAQRLVEPPARVGHARHEVGVVDAEVRVEEGARRGGVAEPAAHEHLGEDVAHAELLGEPPDVGEGGRRDAPGAWIGHECITRRVYRPGATDARAGWPGFRDATPADGDVRSRAGRPRPRPWGRRRRTDPVGDGSSPAAPAAVSSAGVPASVRGRRPGHGHRGLLARLVRHPGGDPGPGLAGHHGRLLARDEGHVLARELRLVGAGHDGGLFRRDDGLRLGHLRRGDDHADRRRLDRGAGLAASASASRSRS